VSISRSIRIDRPFVLPAYVRNALNKLNEAGFVAYIVGGSVRDFLLERESKDHDIATSASPDELEELFPDAVTVGKAFGVMKIPVREQGQPEFLEIATFREDLDYVDHRHPKSVRFSGPEEDAARRDFTINSLFYDAKTKTILDSTGGMEDLKARVVRAIGDPQVRFKEDALRLLRAVRFTTALGFRLDPDTAIAVKARSKLILQVSAERIREELNLMLKGPYPEVAVELLSELDLLKHVLPEVDALRGVPESPSLRTFKKKQEDVWAQTLKTLRQLAIQNPQRDSKLAWATLLRDVGKPIAAKRSGGKNFNGHEIDGARITQAICERLRMSKTDTQTIVGLVENQLKFSEAFEMRESTLQRFIRQPDFESMLALHKAIATSTDGNLAYYEFCFSRYQAMKQSDQSGGAKLLDGKDLIQLGLSPGPGFSEILRKVEDLAMEGELTSKEQALEYVVKHFVR
jgi:poly(A) polymerase